MLTRRSAMLLSVVAFFAFAADTDYSLSAPKLEPRSSNADGVLVIVIPRTIGSNEPVWKFDVTIETHTKPLNDDIAKASVLIDGSAKRYSAMGWDGAGPGGHHRKGTLSFSRPETSSSTITVEIDGVGGAGMRRFSWRLQ